jgi:hypothetical protein
MRLKSYITERRSIFLNDDEVVSLLEDHCGDAIKSKWLIYRGNPDLGGNSYLVDPINAGVRESPYAHGNQYNILLSNLPSWKKYPKRNRSIVGATSIRVAYGYGSEFPYILLPYNGANIGVCPEQDIWYSFKDFPMSETTGLDDFNIHLGFLFYKILGKSNVNTYSDIKKCCDEIDRKIKDEDVEIAGLEGYAQNYVISRLDASTVEWFTHRINYFHTINKLFEAIQQSLDPEYNDFSLTNPGVGFLNDDHEVWTDAKCIMIKATPLALGNLGKIGDILLSKMTRKH